MEVRNSSEKSLNRYSIPSLPILINKKQAKGDSKEQYDIVCSNFDPNKFSSPPDEWQQRLLKRLGHDYNSSFNLTLKYGNKYLDDAV